MIRFLNDYSEGAHPQVLQKLVQTNLESTACYGADPHCLRAEALIQQACDAPQAKVYFISGGTQTNLVFLSTALRPHQGVIAAHSAHIQEHESGAIEATGHRVIVCEGQDGKVVPQAVAELCVQAQQDAQAVIPGVVYISSPSETGSVYTLQEVEALRAVCDAHGLLLYLDGARLGFGLESSGNTLTLPHIARLCDAFYIGGTKQGALLGEALVLCNPTLQPYFQRIMKQRGAVLAKARIMGVQFEALFEDGLYTQISRQVVDKAQRLKAVFAECGIAMRGSNPANILFPQMPEGMLCFLQQQFLIEERIVLSWATREEDVQALMSAIRAFAAQRMHS